MGRRWLALQGYLFQSYGKGWGGVDWPYKTISFKVRGRDGEELIGPTRLSLSKLWEGVGRS